MIFSNLIRAHRRGFQVDPADLERIGVFDQSVCWGVWVPDPRGTDDSPAPRKHLLVSPIHPSVWPFLLRLEVKLREAPGCMSLAAKALVESRLNIQFAESAVSGHHHATWNVVADAIDVRELLHKEFMAVQQIRDEEKIYTNPKLKEFSNEIASKMFAKELAIPKSLIAAHRADDTYRPKALDCGFLHNRIVDRTEFFYDPAKMPTPELMAAAKQGRPQAVTCRWMKNLAFFSVYGDMGNPLRLQYDESAGLLKLSDANWLDTTLERQGQSTSLPTRALASYDTSELYLRIDIIEPGEVWNSHLESTVTYNIRFASTVPGKDDSASGLWLSICQQVAREKINLVKISNRTIDRDHKGEAGSVTLIGRTDRPISRESAASLNATLERECRPLADKAECKIQAKTNRFRNYTIFLSRRTGMPRLEDLDPILEDIARDWGMRLEFVHDRYGQGIDEEVENGVLNCDGMLQIVSYSKEELDRASEHPELLPDLQWLFHEYGMAIGAHKPHVRVFDTAYRKLPGWTRIVSPKREEAAGEYRSSDGIQAIRHQFEKAFVALAQQIERSRHGQSGRVL